MAENEYKEIIRELADNGFQGGIIYDGLIVFCAEKAKAKKIITSNPGDFTRLILAFNLDIEIVGI